MTPHDPLADEHRYQPPERVTLDWGKPDADELRNRRRRLAGTLEGPYGRRPGWFARLMRWLGRWVGAQL